VLSGPLHAAWTPLTLPASWAYGASVRLRNAWLDRRKPWRAPCPVIAVGNITAGGTGKSPMVRWICEGLIASGIRPAVAMRGYRGAADSDEVLEHSEAMPRVPVWVGPDRRAAIERGWATGTRVQAIVLDDGFQHRRVARDFDLVLIDAKRPGIDGGLLPLGWLREPAIGLRRASATVLTRAGETDATVEAAVARWHGRPPLARCSHAWLGLSRVERGVACESALASLRDLPVAVWAGIGYPQAVVAEARRQGAIVRDVPVLRDHQSFDRRRVARWVVRARSAGAEAVLCTAKDWTKLRRFGMPLPVLVPRLGLRFESGEAALREGILAAIQGWKPDGADTLKS
jgi:tetraacyldisaccharide 4'-kinase